MLRLFVIIFLSIEPVVINAQPHPVTFFTGIESKEVKSGIGKYPLLTQSFQELKKEVDAYVGKEVDVPFPKDAAGGYTHDRHKANYMLMFNSGILFNLTGELKYAKLTQALLLKYALLNPTLKNHPQATSSSPGRIFWQALNDANWMVYSGMAYDLIYNSLNIDDRKKIETGAFKPEVDYFTKDLKDWFNLLHNHAVWACAGVGIIGIATNNKDYVDMALYGTNKDGKRGFIAQLDNLFSPDGYYTEGPYYTRYALLPFMMFANAVNNTNPSLKIFEHRNKILGAALNACLQQTNSNGSFFPINDAIKEKNYTTNELVTAISIARKVYGMDAGMLAVAKKQNKVMLNKGGAAIAAEISKNNQLSNYFPYKTIQFGDGVNGDQGGVSILRLEKEEALTSLIFKYTSHGLSHGHFDKLNINLFDRGNEIITDYGSARFVGVEQKFGGRYLPENTGYAAQTIAHNTIVVDETSHFKSEEKIAEKYHSQKLFSDINNASALVVIASEDNAYTNVHLQRSVYLLRLAEGKKIMIDIFNTKATGDHQYDLPFQFNGQFIHASFPYHAAMNKQETLGTKNGYQYLWKEATATAADTTVQFTFLNNSSFYTVSSLVQDTAQLFFTRIGANDPNFNLRHEPAFIIRKKGKDQVFISVIEFHGNYDAVNEFSTNSTPAVQQIKLLENDADFTVVAITVSGKRLVIAQCNRDFGIQSNHALKVNGESIEWKGPYSLLYQGKQLK
jgi:hypothetical protein